MGTGAIERGHQILLDERFIKEVRVVLRRVGQTRPSCVGSMADLTEPNGHWPFGIGVNGVAVLAVDRGQRDRARPPVGKWSRRASDTNRMGQEAGGVRAPG